MLPREELLQSCRQPEAMAPLIGLAEQALRTWEPVWSGFLAADLREEAEGLLAGLSELCLDAEGGWPQAERRCLLLRRSELDQAGEPPPPPPLTGLIVSGNFLFDPAEPADVRSGLLEAGARDDELGDIWMRGDRGAQLVLQPEAAARLDGTTARVRSVEVRLERADLERLQLPSSRSPRELTSVEASKRLDAVASAGFGLSRNRMAELIRSGGVRVNWQPITSPSRELGRGDRVRIDGRGELEILEVEPTKRERWRLRMRRI